MPGPAAPAGVIWKGQPTNYLVELPDSGSIALNDRSTYIRKYAGLYDPTVLLSILPRGTFGTGGMAGWVVADCRAERHPDKKSLGILTLTWEAGGAYATIPLPIDEFDVQPQELYPKIERHPIFKTPVQITADSCSDAYAVVYGSNKANRKDAKKIIDNYTDADQKALAIKLYTKLKNGEETYYKSAIRYSWHQHSYTLPTLSVGGAIETPGGPLAGYFYGLDFLRLADSLMPAGINGSMYKRTRTWLGALAGYWDDELYS
jgi:hypothetical protein